MASFLLDPEKRLRMLAALVDGNSERAVERMTGVNRETVGRYGLTFGRGAAALHNLLAHDLSCSMVQVDEIWSYIGVKKKRATPEHLARGLGEAYTFVGIDTSSRFAIAWHVGPRDQEATDAFVENLRARLVVMPSMTSDGWKQYIPAIGKSFGYGIDYAQTVKNYRNGGGRESEADRRYEPARDPFITKKIIFGAPDLDKASTAYMERQNGTMRHHIGRMRRLCYAFSKHPDHHRAAVDLCYVHYNLCHVVKTLRVTPAMALGITDHVWELPELCDALLTAAPCEAPTAKPLAFRQPSTTARALPPGRGFLRVVGASTGSPAPAAPPAPSPPTAPVLPAVASLGATLPNGLAFTSAPDVDPRQIDLFTWKPAARPLPPPGTQLSLFKGE